MSGFTHTPLVVFVHIAGFTCKHLIEISLQDTPTPFYAIETLRSYIIQRLVFFNKIFDALLLSFSACFANFDFGFSNLWICRWRNTSQAHLHDTA
jgi:hypothetical protein